MTDRPNTPPSTISLEAQTFIRNSVFPEPRAIDRETIGNARQSAHDYYAPIGMATAQACGVSLRQSDLGGVPVEICTPERVMPARADCALLYFFGGGYVVGSPEEDLMIIAKLATFLGMVVYAPRYRLAPEHPYPAALNDGFAAYKGLLADHDASQIAVAGESAGGNLALVTLLQARQQRYPLPVSLALLSPWTDLSGESESQTMHRGLDPTFSMQDNGNSEALAYAAGRDLRDPMISPLFQSDWNGFPPTIITSGTRDLLMSDSARLHQSMRQSGCSATLNLWEGMWHVFEAYPEIPEAEASLEEVALFIGTHLQ